MKVLVMVPGGSPVDFNGGVIIVTKEGQIQILPKEAPK